MFSTTLTLVNLLSFCVLCEVKTKNTGFESVLKEGKYSILIWETKILFIFLHLKSARKKHFGYQSMWKT